MVVDRFSLLKSSDMADSRISPRCQPVFGSSALESPPADLEIFRDKILDRGVKYYIEQKSAHLSLVRGRK